MAFSIRCFTSGFFFVLGRFVGVALYWRCFQGVTLHWFDCCGFGQVCWVWLCVMGVAVLWAWFNMVGGVLCWCDLWVWLSMVGVALPWPGRASVFRAP